jgi:hypothetical protein
MRRGWRAAAIAVVAQLVLAGAVVAADGWTLTMDPDSVKPDVVTTVTLRATDTGGSSDTGCIYVVIPDTFVVEEPEVLDYSGPTTWAAKIKTAGAGTTVQIRNSDGNGKLKQGDWVRFQVNVTGTDPGTYVWTANASQGNDCKDPTLASIGLSVTVAAPAPPKPTAAPTPTVTPTPKPAATATPTAGSTARPTANPTPRPSPGATSAPTPPPSAGATTGPIPSAGTSATPLPPGVSPTPTPTAIDPSPGASSPPGASPTPTSASPTASPALGVLVAGGGDGGAGDPPVLSVPNLDGTSPTIELDGLFLSSSFSAFAWVVPGFLLGLPGLLVLLVVGAQAIGAAVFIPITRRVLGRSHRGGRQLAQ